MVVIERPCHIQEAWKMCNGSRACLCPRGMGLGQLCYIKLKRNKEWGPSHLSPARSERPARGGMGGLTWTLKQHVYKRLCGATQPKRRHDNKGFAAAPHAFFAGPRRSSQTKVAIGLNLKSSKLATKRHGGYWETVPYPRGMENVQRL